MSTRITPPRNAQFPRDLRISAKPAATIEEALSVVEKLALAINHTPRLPVTAVCRREPNGSLTITVTPTTSAADTT